MGKEGEGPDPLVKKAGYRPAIYGTGQNICRVSRAIRAVPLYTGLIGLLVVISRLSAFSRLLYSRRHCDITEAVRVLHNVI